MAVDSSQLTPADWDTIRLAAERAICRRGRRCRGDPRDRHPRGDGAVAGVDLHRRGAAGADRRDAQRRRPDADGPGNLRNALTLAAGPATRGGVLVAFGGRALSPSACARRRPGSTGHRHPIAFPQQHSWPTSWPLRRPGGYCRRVRGQRRGGAGRLRGGGRAGSCSRRWVPGNAGAAVVDAVARHCAAGVTVAVSSRVPGAGVPPDYGPALMFDAGAGGVALGPPQAGCC